MRQRIFLGFASILILFLGIGLYAFWLFSRIGGALDVIVSDSHQWVLGGKVMANAARHSMPGEDVILSATAIGKSVRLSVLDHGPGIPKEFQGRIFERFFRVPGTEDSTGAGLGLAIAKEMVVSHGGSIGLQSTLGKGSEFYFDLPAISKGAKA
jgi:K+-sensing histidine kinase KdpD